MAQWAEEITLIQSDSNETNANGFPIETENATRSVFCNKKSVGMSEYYKSQQAGYKLEHKVEVHSCDYGKEEYAELEGSRYKIVKTYTPPDTDVTELTLGNLNADIEQAGGK